MAQQEASTSPGAEVVGRAFVEQYYHILHQSPGLVHRFYQDSSLLTRPDVTGSVTTVTTMQAINDKIMSLSYEDYTAEIDTADAQESHERGVIVLVTGRLTGKDNVRKRFSQTFFLAPQDKGYFVLNDVFRFLEEKEVTRSVAIKEVEAPVEPERVVVVSREAEVEPEPVASIEEEDVDNVAEVYDDPCEKDEGVVVDVEPIVEPPPAKLNHSEVLSVSHGDPPTYASILKLMRSGPAPPTHVAARNKPRAAPVRTNQKPTPPPPAEHAAAPNASLGLENVHNSSNADVEDDGHSIYVRNLPFDTTPTQLEEVFKSFGAVKHEGIQVRSNKQQGFCFGFVEFETSSGRQSALEASPITIGDRQVVLEEKKTNTRGGNNGGGRGRYFGGRGSFRNESFKGGRGGVGGGGRGGYGRGEYSGRPKSSNPRSGGEGYQRVPQNGGSGRGSGGGGRGGPRGGGVSS
ncbi:Nuclear transport factor 2 (NTF2) family protein with RNA binding (RRM-RBD-RNP motifs) domain [Raphanus sativus]|uniref:Nuclear transport factor 2-like isoform X1 n=1 Tax=Raphanus sativus TaxID=3726 RepID=A0A9W3CNH4_RAPSA|nr:nuclear transport factor 2-like isoform X1 [Raphanus sativus]KAJ4871998.1 Nuclear transport factor 2 (NTF2) family protein with RNA binding (RRM-RBD-RNP motifs) domain [Raphanus sativus]